MPHSGPELIDNYPIVPYYNVQPQFQQAQPQKPPKNKPNYKAFADNVFDTINNYGLHSVQYHPGFYLHKIGNAADTSGLPKVDLVSKILGAGAEILKFGWNTYRDYKKEKYDMKDLEHARKWSKRERYYKKMNKYTKKVLNPQRLLSNCLYKKSKEGL